MLLLISHKQFFDSNPLNPKSYDDSDDDYSSEGRDEEQNSDQGFFLIICFLLK
jgi:hypothetical protein